jgi:hypothetical protein
MPTKFGTTTCCTVGRDGVVVLDGGGTDDVEATVAAVDWTVAVGAAVFVVGLLGSGSTPKSSRSAAMVPVMTQNRLRRHSGFRLGASPGGGRLG